MLFTTLPATRAEAQAPTEEPSHLTLRREGGERCVLMQDLFEWLSTQFPDFKGTWDPINSDMRIQAEGTQIVVFGGKPLIEVNRASRKVDRAIMLRKGRVLIPIASVQIILEALGFEADFGQDTSPAVSLNAPEVTPPAALTPTPAAPSAVPPATATPAATATPVPPSVALGAFEPSVTPEPAATATPASIPPPANMSTTTDTEAPPDDTPVPAVILQAAEPPAATDTPIPAGDSGRSLQPPPSLAGKIGLSWGQLADVAHRQPPREVTIIYDAALAEVANRAHDKLADGSGLSVTLVEAPSARRDSDGVIGAALGSAPQLLVDLILLPAESAQESFHVWTVHDALWPQDRQSGRGTEEGVAQRYRNHQFQSLALGSLLRSELGSQFPDGPAVSYELSPAYLLRRANSPSAAVLIPAPIAGGADNDERIARAVFAAVAAYIEGMRSVQF